MRSVIFLSFLAAALFVSAAFSVAAAGHGKVLVGGWKPIKNVTDSHVLEIAGFAVEEYNKQTKNPLKLINVVRGESQVVSGIKYRLIIEASSRDASQGSGKYEIIVWEKIWQHFRKLTSFKPIEP